MTQLKNMIALGALVIAFSAAPAMAEETTVTNSIQTSFSQAVKTIQNWFDTDNVTDVEPAAGTESVTAGVDDALQVPPMVNPETIEPAAGNVMNDDTLQVPPQYVAPMDIDETARPRASAFDDTPSIAAFGGDAEAVPSVEDLANIATAAGDGAEVNMGDVACDKVAEAAANAVEGEGPDASIVAACEHGTDKAAEIAKDVAQPALGEPATETTPAMMEEQNIMPTMPEALPETRPAAGDVVDAVKDAAEEMITE